MGHILHDDLPQNYFFVFLITQILRGSQKCGRIEHVMVGGQTGADLDRVDFIKGICKLEFVEMEPGMSSTFLLGHSF